MPDLTLSQCTPHPHPFEGMFCALQMDQTRRLESGSKTGITLGKYITVAVPTPSTSGRIMYPPKVHYFFWEQMAEGTATVV